MQAITRLKLGGLIQLAVGELYEEDAIEGIKQELEAMHGVKLLKNPTDNHFFLLCKNSLAQNKCTYCVRFSIQFRANRANRRILQLQNFHLEHRPECHNAEEAHFLRNKHILNQNYEAIIKLIRKRTQTGKPIKNPTELLEVFCEQEKLNKNFLYEGLENNDLKRKIKKKFDNIIADARRKCRQYQFSSDQKLKNQDSNMNVNNEDDDDSPFRDPPQELPYLGIRPLKKKIHKQNK